ncbi:Extradiol ring-cleavage dioxygenase class III enzyme subunit B [Trametes gibbosa]|nr:Extradiol ring-cleavage dioxygenase class III enzyme subunit B [Trametes gibbosa]
MSVSNGSSSVFPKTQTDWEKAIEELPATPEKIPAFFFGHGSPMLAFGEREAQQMGSFAQSNGPRSSLATFLKVFGPALLSKYKPKGIVVFSAHWETHGERLVTDYGDENPLLMDYYGFQPALYKLKFKSRGDEALSQRVVQLYENAGHLARTTTKEEARGKDGRGFSGPGLDHGVFVPFRLMFGEEFTDIPIVEVSIDGSLDPRKNWALGEVVAPLRREGILVLSGGLLVHNLRDMSSFSEEHANSLVKEFNQAILDALIIPDYAARKEALLGLVKHAGFRAAHPRADHFVPLYVGAGVGGPGSNAKVVCAIYGAPTVAFDL